MKLTFKEWLNEGPADMTASHIGGAVYPDTSSNLGYSTNPSVSDRTLPWQMNLFKNWYNGNRGNWADVEKAAQANPAIRTFLKTAAAKLVNAPKPTMQRNPYGDESGEFDTEAPTLTGTIADQLEKMVKQVVPTHGKEHNWQLPPGYSPNANQTTNKATPRTPDSMKPLANNGSDTTQIMGAIQHIWRRQDQLEKDIQKVNTHLGFTSAA